MISTSPPYDDFFIDTPSTTSVASDATLVEDWEVDVYDFYPSRLLAQFPPYAQVLSDTQILSQRQAAQHVEEYEYDVIEYNAADFLPPEVPAQYWGREQAQFICMPRPSYPRANFSAILDGEWDLNDAGMKQQFNTEQQKAETKNILGLTGLSPVSTTGSPSATFESSFTLSTASHGLGPKPAPQGPHKANVEGLFRVARALLSHGLLLTPAEWCAIRQWEKELDGMMASIPESEPRIATQSSEWIAQAKNDVIGLIDAMVMPVEEYWMLY